MEIYLKISFKCLIKGPFMTIIVVVVVEMVEVETTAATVVIKDAWAEAAQAEVTINLETKVETKIGTRREIGNSMIREMILR